ncbi:putative ADP-ribosylation factor [Podospora appendiculata]|uniref:ADP-ribosylation factor n=1 Tax=Podospora appendiculata TaxID=314037 RepID=A0AAE0X1K8_9PEZI|nr:putative ADP-ribosylation factor [Podospora appendiculata]
MSDEVSDFLRSVELLKGRREEEDEARSRDLEQKILQDKKERQVRRAERARSISPQKSSPVNSPSPASQRNVAALLPALDSMNLSSSGIESSGSPRARPVLPPPSDTMDGATDYFGNSTTKENDSPFDSGIKRSSLNMASHSNAPPLSRSPLSWQRRPTSQASDRPKSRPLSVMAAENAASRSSPTPTEPVSAEQQPELTREQVARSLAGKDPSFFRQTPDRGQTSAAYRRSQVEDQDTSDMTSMRAQLPGMSRDDAKEPSKDISDSRPHSPMVQGRLGSPLPLTRAQRLEPPTDDVSADSVPPSADRQVPASPGGRTSPTRPVSPTKGLGGFVQSAMMKRSDSVKRWSVTSPGGLQRADSAVSSRNTSEASQRPRPHSRHGSVLKDEITTPSRPTSSYEMEEEHTAMTTTTTAATTSTAASTTAKETTSTQAEEDEAEHITPPASPSKTMDPRRWSPNKSSSWLDAALNKPDSPKPKPTPPAANQPAWMVELNKAKAHKTTPLSASSNADLARSPSVPKKPEVKVGGLMRSTPMGTTVKPAGLGIFPTAPIADKPLASGFRSDLVKPPSRRGSEDPASERQQAPDQFAAASKVKPETPPKKDFRANLKPRAPPPETSTSEEAAPDLKNVLGTLRRAKTEKYVAPDELKGNILRGKAALNATGGPKRNERKDEFKEAILKKKEDFKKAQQEGRSVPRTSSSVSEKSIPEGLAKKMEITRSGFASGTDSTASGSPMGSPSFASESNRSSYLSITPRRGSTDVAIQPASRFASKAEKEPVSNPGGSLSLHKETSAPARLQSKVGGGGLADRFSPALAGLLAKGPPAAYSSSNNLGAAAASGSGVTKEEPSAGPGPQLTHMTKNRARGPRRKAPTSVVKSTDEPEEPKPQANPVDEKPATPTKGEKPVPAPKPDTVSLVDSRRSMQGKTNPVGSIISLVDATKRESEEEPRASGQPTAPSSVDSYSVKTRPRSPTKVHEQVAALAARTQQSPRLAEKTEETSFPPTPRVDSPSIRTRPRSPTKVHEQVAALVAKNQQLPSPTDAGVESGTQSVARVDSYSIRTRPRSPTKVQEQAALLAALSLQSPKLEDNSADASARTDPHTIKTRPRSPTKVHEQAAALAALSLQSPKLADNNSEPPARTDSHTIKTRPRSPTKVHEQAAALAALSLSSKTADPNVETASQPSSPRKLNLNRMSKFLDDQGQPSPKPEPEPEKPLPPPPPKERSLPSFASTSQTKQPASDKVDSESVVSVKSGSVLFGGASGSLTQSSSKPKQILSDPFEVEQRPRLPPKGARPLPAPPPRSVQSPESSPRSPSKYGVEVSSLLNDFFGSHRPTRSYTADAAEILMRRPSSGAKIQTHRAQLFQISGDGKKAPVPSHYERVLFEREMYLCPHSFTNNAGKKVSEVYFWAGDDVPVSIVEDAHVFAQREARSFGGKLVKLVQGKETSEFMQALGGIVIIRRGSSNKYDSLASNMLCGRRYLGQVVFDEVDFSPSSLCSGFPYLITQQGKCFLWKGKGSDVDELGCARLVGMDLSLMSELLEIEEASEPASFWEIFDGGSRSQSADHWRLKPNYDKYCGRLFCCTADRQQITEIAPFKQTDLLPTNIYVLDAFFEMYIIVGSRSQNQYAAFHNALDFAQEYSILAAGIEDRPFVPVSTVVLEGMPRDLKSVFRKWQDGNSPTVMNPNNPTTPNLKRGRSLRIVPLNQALAAVSDR